MKTFLISIFSATFMMALRYFDQASILSIILVILGVTGLLYGLRHTTHKKDLIINILLFVSIYIVRFYDYTDSKIQDILLGAGIGLIMFIIMAFELLFKKHKDKSWYVFIFPVTYTLFMYFTEIVKINLPFRLDTYFSNFTIYCQITSLLGIYVLDFLLALTASTIVYIIDHKHTKTIKLIYVAIIRFVFGFGVVHYNKINDLENLKTDTVRIVCATGPNNDAYQNNTAYPNIDESINILSETVEKASKQNAEIFLFCEEAYGINDINEEELIDTTKSLAIKNHIHILLAYEIADTDNDNNGKGINKLCFISNEGIILYEYIKHCIVPFIETAEYVKGNQKIESFDIEVHGKNLKIASAICYDTDFDYFMSTMDKDTDILLAPTWDWDVVRNQHLSVCQLRAISNGVTLVRSTFDGYNAVINSTGKILDQDSTVNTDYKNIFVYDVPFR